MKCDCSLCSATTPIARKLVLLDQAEDQVRRLEQLHACNIGISGHCGMCVAFYNAMEGLYLLRELIEAEKK